MLLNIVVYLLKNRLGVSLLSRAITIRLLLNLPVVICPVALPLHLILLNLLSQFNLCPIEPNLWNALKLFHSNVTLALEFVVPLRQKLAIRSQS